MKCLGLAETEMEKPEVEKQEVQGETELWAVSSEETSHVFFLSDFLEWLQHSSRHGFTAMVESWENCLMMTYYGSDSNRGGAI